MCIGHACRLHLGMHGHLLACISTLILTQLQAFAEPSFAISAADATSPQQLRNVAVRPHALGGHVPGLLGPLPVISSDSPAADSDSDDDHQDAACSLLVLGWALLLSADWDSPVVIICTVHHTHLQ